MASLREDVLMHADDAHSLGVREGDWVMLRSTIGEMRARVKLANIKPHNVQVTARGQRVARPTPLRPSRRCASV